MTFFIFEQDLGNEIIAFSGQFRFLPHNFLDGVPAPNHHGWILLDQLKIFLWYNLYFILARPQTGTLPNFFHAIDNLRPPTAGTPLKGVFKISNHSFSTTDINFKNFLELTKILSFSTNKNFQLFLAFDDQNSSSKN